MESKLKEAVFMLLQLRPDVGQVLFNFSSLWKIDLEEFMNKNYKYDLSIDEFAHYTGRSLSTFKKDFARIFSLTPSRWIVKRRLEEAKNLSHSSTAFKKEFGYPPSERPEASVKSSF